MFEKAKKIWMDGEVIDWERAVVHVISHTLHYGLGVFEGIRCYRTQDGRSAIFRLDEHIDRLYASAHIATLEIPYTREELKEAAIELIKANDMDEAYIRPIVFIAEGSMGIYPKDYRIATVIAVWRWGAYLGEEGFQKGIRAKVSSLTRHHVNAAMTRAKICGNYVNSVLAKKEVVEMGFDEAILLDTEGYVAEASGENIFIVKAGRIKTPPLTSILPGVTRDAVITIAKDIGIDLTEERFTRDELYIADEAFLTGTAAEITAIREVDGRRIGDVTPGPVTSRLRESFFNIVRGKDDRYKNWLTYL